ncbi:MAG: toxin-antitoxin system HicB family antitoxin [Chloroflexota bacterium]
MMIDLKIELSEREVAQLKQISAEDNISIDQLVEWMVREKLGRLYIENMAAKGSREKFEAVLAKVPNVEPEPYDRLDYDPAGEDGRPERTLAEKPDEDYEG